MKINLDQLDNYSDDEFRVEKIKKKVKNSVDSNISKKKNRKENKHKTDID